MLAHMEVCSLNDPPPTYWCTEEVNQTHRSSSPFVKFLFLVNRRAIGQYPSPIDITMVTKGSFGMHPYTVQLHKLRTSQFCLFVIPRTSRYFSSSGHQSALALGHFALCGWFIIKKTDHQNRIHFYETVLTRTLVHP